MRFEENLDIMGMLRLIVRRLSSSQNNFLKRFAKILNFAIIILEFGFIWLITGVFSLILGSLWPLAAAAFVTIYSLAYNLYFKGRRKVN